MILVPVLLWSAPFGHSSENGAKGDQTEQYFVPWQDFNSLEMAFHLVLRPVLATFHFFHNHLRFM